MEQTTRLDNPALFRPSRLRMAALSALCVVVSATASAQISPCDLDGNGITNMADATRAAGMIVGTVPCTANVEGPQQCTVVTLQRVVNAALGQTCAVYSTGVHSVEVSWLPSPSVGVTGYNIYRRMSPGGGYTLINSAQVTGTTFTDTAVQLGQTYYYVATSTDGDGNESEFSTEVAVAVPAA